MRSSFLVAVASTLFIPPLSAAENAPPQQVDQIFAAYDRAGSPGCSLGVMRDGKFVYRKSYGEASLELGVPLSPESVFYVGSISKQFTAASVVLAAEQGFLSLDDDVRKYIPELPNYGHTITLRQMLNQTSGFRDFFDLVYFSGHDIAEFNSPDEILRLIVRQKELNNTPGGEWVYSNTNYFLLGIVIQRATKKTLAEFAAENIFRPLGMIHTRFYDDAAAVVPGRVAAYDAETNGNFRVDWSTTYAIVGGGGLMTNVDDLLAWDNNFYADRLGKGTLVKDLETPGILNDGNKTTYGMGLFVGSYRGLPMLEHDGVFMGYRADMLRFPKQKFAVACLCNIANADPEDRARQIADLYLRDDLKSDAMTAPSAGAPLPDPAVFAGTYLDRRTQTIYSFSVANGNLMGWGSELRRKNANQFYDQFGDAITFEGSGESMKATLVTNGEVYFAGKRLSEVHPGEAELSAFAGEYRSQEVDGDFRLSIENGSLVLKNGGFPPVQLTAVAKDEFIAEWSFLFVFHRDGRGRVSGLTVSQQAARGIAFSRAN
jgi:CubicO group peptidase (beta-lactamase class C family)